MGSPARASFVTSPCHLRAADTNLAVGAVRWSCCAKRKYSTAISWNVNSLRALCRNNPTALNELIQENNADLLCLQVS